MTIIILIDNSRRFFLPIAVWSMTNNYIDVGRQVSDFNWDAILTSLDFLTTGFWISNLILFLCLIRHILCRFNVLELNRRLFKSIFYGFFFEMIQTFFRYIISVKRPIIAKTSRLFLQNIINMSTQKPLRIFQALLQHSQKLRWFVKNKN